MRILVVKLSSLGDILHVLPCVHELRTQLGAEIDWAVHPEFASIVRCFADVDGVIEFPRHKVLRGLAPAIRSLRSKEYDLVVDLHGLFKSAIVARFARARRRIAPSYARECSWLFFSERAGRFDRTRHAAEQAFDTLGYLKLKRPQGAFRAALRVHEPYPLPKSERTIAFAPVSRWPTKNWLPERFGELARILLGRDDGLRIAIVGGKGDVAVGEAIVDSSGAPGRVSNLCGRTSIAESFDILSRCDLLVANDTGPVHMAAAVGTRCAVLFGPTRPDWTGPYGEGHRIIMRDLPCQPCLRRKCRRGDLACLTSISAAEVADIVSEMFAASGALASAPSTDKGSGKAETH